MYTLRLFGSPLLEGPDGPLSGRVVQKRRIALLAFLARAERRTVTRDRLAAMFWPESETKRARHNLADSVWVVRSELGDDALVARGDRLTLSPEVVGTDVDVFEEALRADDLEGAVTSYGGPLLDGLHVTGAPEFERWLDTERARLAARHTRALEELARRALEERRASDAVLWSRHLAAAHPLNSRYALQVARNLATTGDAAGAIEHTSAHIRRLREELDLPPPRELTDFLQSLEQTGRYRRGEPEDVVREERPAGGASGMSDRTIDGAPGRGWPETTPDGVSREASGRLGSRLERSVKGMAAAAIGLLAWIGTSVDREGPPLVADRIVVLPFDVLSGDVDLHRLGELAGDVLLRGLSRSGVGEVVLPPEMLGSRLADRDGPRGVARARRIALEFGADITVSGTLHRRGRASELVARVASRGGLEVIAVLDEPVDRDQPGPALERLGSRVAGTIAAHLGEDLPEHPFVVPTPSYESYRTADRAMTVFLRGDYQRSAALFRRAYDLDTTAVGYLLWEAVSYENVDDRPRIAVILDELRPRRDELTRFDAAQFDWLEAMMNGDRAGALRAARAARREDPHSGLGGFQVGLELLRSGRPEAALDIFLSLDPDRGWLSRWPPYWNDLAMAYHLLGRYEDELAAAQEGYVRHPGEVMLNRRTRALAALGRTRQLRQVLRESTAPSARALAAARTFHRHGRDSLAVVMAEDGLARLPSTPLQLDAPLSDSTARRDLEVGLLVMAGRLPEAHEILVGLLARDPTNRDHLAWTGVVEARLGRAAAARGRIESLRTLGQAPYTEGGHIVARAAIHTELGDDPRMVRTLLERSHREGWSLHWFHFTPLFDSVRDHPDVRDFFQLAG